MNAHSIILSADQMKALARCQITLKDLTENADPASCDISCSDVYPISVEDLCAALKALIEKNPSVQSFTKYWFSPITMLNDEFNLDMACVSLDNSMDDYLPLLTTDVQHFTRIWWAFEDIALEFSDETRPLSELLDLSYLYDETRRYLQNRGKPIDEWDFSLVDKMSYIIAFDEDPDMIDSAAESAVDLLRRFTDELCALGSLPALHLKGYACYGGNRLYSCDFHASLDCIQRLFEKDDNPVYANTLGYIHYYGRCTDGNPDYSKAFEYFTYGAIHGIYESKYKLADMYCHGYGCRESPRTARTLYGQVYTDTRIHFLDGEHTNFADAALRMGKIYEQGIGVEPDLATAYHYYLQADYAARLRAEDSDFFGDTAVALNARKALDDILPLLPANFFKPYVDYEVPLLFRVLTGNNNRCRLSREKASDEHWLLTAERLPTPTVPHPSSILITIPELKLCMRSLYASYIVENGSALWFQGDSSVVTFNYFNWNRDEKRIEFYFDDALVAWTDASLFRIKSEPAKAPSGPQYKLVTTRFGTNDKTYDYLCDLDDVNPGDHVIVNGYDGETIVTVVRVTTKHESELSLPAERYQRILRKAE